MLIAVEAPDNLQDAPALGKIDVLVCNTGIRPHRPITEVSDEEWHQVMGVNFHSAFYLSRAVIPGMVARRQGSIIALGGQAAITGRPNTAAVTAAKTGLLGLIRAIAAELAPYNVRGCRARLCGTPQSIPMRLQGTVHDIANACLFFASDESS